MPQGTESQPATKRALPGPPATSSTAASSGIQRPSESEPEMARSKQRTMPPETQVHGADRGSKRAAPDAVEGIDPRVPGPDEEARGQKRAAELPAGELDPRAAEHVDSDIRVPASASWTASPGARPEPSGPPQASRPSSSGEQSWSSLDVLSTHKEEMRHDIENWIAGCYRHQEVDISEFEVSEIATTVLGLTAVDVAEVYSPPRFCERAAEFKLIPGFSVDLSTSKPLWLNGGGSWDLTRDKDVAELKELQEKESPRLLTTSAPCEYFSPLLNIKMTEEEREARKVLGRRHLMVSIEACKRQLDAGHHFLYEHPWGASSWKEGIVTDFMQDPRVICVKGPMCNWELMGCDASGPGYVRKETGWLTSSPHIAKKLEGVCTNYSEERPFHRHVHLVNGRAGAAKVYTPQLVAGVLRALRDQLVEEGDISTMEVITSGPVPEEKVIGDGPWLRYWDDVNGGYLEPEKVRRRSRRRAVKNWSGSTPERCTRRSRWPLASRRQARVRSPCGGATPTKVTTSRRTTGVAYSSARSRRGRVLRSACLRASSFRRCRRSRA